MYLAGDQQCLPRQITGN